MRLPASSKTTSAPPLCDASWMTVRGFFLLPGRAVPQHGQMTVELLPFAFVANGSIKPGRGFSLPCPPTIRNSIGPPSGLLLISRAMHSPSSASRKCRALVAPFFESQPDLKIGISAPQLDDPQRTVRAHRYAIGLAPSGSGG